MNDIMRGHQRTDHEDCECSEELDHDPRDCACPGYILAESELKLIVISYTGPDPDRYVHELARSILYGGSGKEERDTLAEGDRYT